MSDLLDEAAAIVERERETLIARAADEIARPGTIHCDACGDEIALARRAAAPFAIRCIDCQTRFERTS